MFVIWKVRTMPSAATECGFRPVMSLSSNITLPLRRAVSSGQQIEDRRLAGAVGPDQTDDLARLDAHVESGDGLQARRISSSTPQP